MQLPIRAFWLLDTNIDRLSAQKDMRQLGVQVTAAAAKQEYINRFRDALVLELDAPYKFDPVVSAVRDRAGFEQLRALAKQR